MKIILTGGGTGGHIYPALGIAEALRAENPEAELLFIGSRHGPEGRIAQRAGLRFIGLPSRSFGRKLSMSNAAALLTLAGALIRAIVVLRRERPDLVIGTGGYTSAAVVLAQSLRRKPTLIHEQNAVPGRTNLLLARFVNAVCVTYEESVDRFRCKNVRVTGLPIRREIMTPWDKADARVKLGLMPDLFTVLAYGGSQGAQGVNRLMVAAVDLLRGQGVQILHQTGARNYDEVKEVAPTDADFYRIVGYLDEPEVAYRAADLIVCRSGASTLAEVCAVGLPAILVPYPYAYADHQMSNARVLEKRGAAVIVNEKTATGGELANHIAALQRDAERLRRMGEASIGLAQPDAALNVAKVAKTLIRGGLKP